MKLLISDDTNHNKVIRMAARRQQYYNVTYMQCRMAFAGGSRGEYWNLLKEAFRQTKNYSVTAFCEGLQAVVMPFKR